MEFKINYINNAAWYHIEDSVSGFLKKKPTLQKCLLIATKFFFLMACAKSLASLKTFNFTKQAFLRTFGTVALSVYLFRVAKHLLSCHRAQGRQFLEEIIKNLTPTQLQPTVNLIKNITLSQGETDTWVLDNNQIHANKLPCGFSKTPLTPEARTTYRLKQQSMAEPCNIMSDPTSFVDQNRAYEVFIQNWCILAFETLDCELLSEFNKYVQDTFSLTKNELAPWIHTLVAFHDLKLLNTLKRNNIKLTSELQEIFKYIRSK